MDVRIHVNIHQKIQFQTKTYSVEILTCTLYECQFALYYCSFVINISCGGGGGGVVV